MKREILFRGMEYGSSEWVYGGVVKDFRSDDILLFDGVYDDGCERTAYDVVSVKPETVGQYIGRKDVNGVKIFEGDVLLCNSTTKQYVAWSDRWNGWKLRNIDNIGGSIDICQSDEIIGTIHDNPELMEH